MLYKTLLLTITICALAVLAIGQSAHGQIDEFKLTGSDAASGDQFGSSVSISGDYAIVGAGHDDNVGFRSGSAYIFVRDGQGWTEQAKLTAAAAAAFDQFGSSVSNSGDYAIVGAWGDDDGGSSSCSAYIFVRDGQSWTEQAKLTAGDAVGDDNFGFSVSINGDYTIIGAEHDDDGGSKSGSAYIFVRDGQSWTEQAKLTASDAVAGDWFGWSVSISGDYAIVGAVFDDDGGTSSGSAYVYSGIIVGVEDETAGMPTGFTLLQNYPNPFNPQTVIEYALPIRSEVNLIIYNLRGQEVALLFNGNMPAGNHQVIWDASSMASGVYLYRLQAGKFTETRKMNLLK